MTDLKGDPCKFCDSPGGKITFKNQVCMPINGRVQCIDYCIHQIVIGPERRMACQRLPLAAGTGRWTREHHHWTMAGFSLLNRKQCSGLKGGLIFPKNFWGES